MPLGDLSINLTFLFGFFLHRAEFYTVPASWSLFVEEIFYLIFPFIYSGQSNLKRILVAITICFGISRAVKGFSLIDYLQPSVPYYKGIFLFSNIHFILIGSFLAEVVKTAKAKYFIEQLKQNRIKSALDLGAVLLFFSPTYGVHFPYNLEIAVPVLVFCAYIDGGFLGKFLSSAPLLFAGKRCYSIYLWHGSLGIFAADSVIQMLLQNTLLHAGVFSAVRLVVTLVVTFILSVLSYRYLEFPMIKFGKKIAGQFS